MNVWFLSYPHIVDSYRACAVGGIYALSSTRNRKIVYIGQALDLNRRHIQHRYHETQAQLRAWLAQERPHGFDLVFQVLEYCDNPPDQDPYWQRQHRENRETYWLERVCPSLNRRKRSWDRFTYEPPLTLSRTEEALVRQLEIESLGFVENWLGYIGVRYHPEYDSWTVQANGHLVKRCDDPKLSFIQKYYFTDLEEAIGARNGHRHKFTYGNWPKDDVRMHRNNTNDPYYDKCYRMACDACDANDAISNK